MDSEKHRFPYEHAVKAMAYAGLSLDEIRDVLKRAYFAVPPKGDGSLRSIVAKHRAAARTLHDNFCLSEGDIEDSCIDPIFTWARTFDDIRRHPSAIFAERMMQKMKNITLRIIIDTMIYLGFDDDKIVNEFPFCYDAPSIPIDREEVAFYRYFFWNDDEMLPADWRWYYTLMDPKSKLAQNLDRLLNSSRRMALYEAGLSMDEDHIAMGKRVGERCIIESSEVSPSESPYVKNLCWNTAKNWLMALMKIKEMEGSTSHSDIDERFKALRLISDKNASTDPVPISQIKGDASEDFESNEQLEAVLNAEATKFANYNAGEKPDVKSDH